MTISSEITKLNANLTNSYTAVSGKGGTISQAQNFDNLATAISSIPSAGGIGIPREVKNGVYQMPTENFTFSLPSDATDVGMHGLYGAFSGCTGLTSVDLSSLTMVSGVQGLYGAFSGCKGLTSVDFSSLTMVSGNQSFSQAFTFCTGLTSIDFPALTTVFGNQCFSFAFQYCTALSDIYFRALTTSSFGTYTNQFNAMMQSTGATITHTLHFPSNMESTISGLQGYPLFAGTSGYVVCAFDLPATE